MKANRIRNPASPSITFTATGTTRDAGGNTIDGPLQTNVYTVRQIGANDVADQAITSAAIATSFAYQREVADGVNGWDPNSATTTFCKRFANKVDTPENSG